MIITTTVNWSQMAESELKLKLQLQKSGSSDNF